MNNIITFTRQHLIKTTPPLSQDVGVHNVTFSDIEIPCTFEIITLYPCPLICTEFPQLFKTTPR